MKIELTFNPLIYFNWPVFLSLILSLISSFYSYTNKISYCDFLAVLCRPFTQTTPLVRNLRKINLLHTQWCGKETSSLVRTFRKTLGNKKMKYFIDATDFLSEKEKGFLPVSVHTAFLQWGNRILIGIQVSHYCLKHTTPRPVFFIFRD